MKPGAFGPAELPSELRVLRSGLRETDAFALDARLREAVRLERRIDAELGEHLLAMSERRSAPTLERYAREVAGVSPRRARGLLRVARAARRVPALGEAWRAGRVSWVRARTLIPALLEEPQRADFWLERARRLTVRGLEDEVDAREARATARQMGSQPMGRDESCEIFWVGPADVIGLFRAALSSLRRRFGLASDGAAFEVMLEHALGSWSPPSAPIRKAWRIFERDGWRCTVPGCGSLRNLHDHHVVFRSAGGGDDEGNRTTLCAWHHLRGVHGGHAAGPVVRVAGRAPDRLRFELGLRDGRLPLLSFAGDERVA